MLITLKEGKNHDIIYVATIGIRDMNIYLLENISIIYWLRVKNIK